MRWALPALAGLAALGVLGVVFAAKTTASTPSKMMRYFYRVSQDFGVGRMILHEFTSLAAARADAAALSRTSPIGVWIIASTVSVHDPSMLALHAPSQFIAEYLNGEDHT